MSAKPICTERNDAKKEVAEQITAEIAKGKVPGSGTDASPPSKP